MKMVAANSFRMATRGIYCPIIPSGDKNREENWYLANFPYFGGKIEDFLQFSIYYSLKMQ